METKVQGSRLGAFKVLVASLSLAFCWGWSVGAGAESREIEPVVQAPGRVFKPLSEIRADARLERAELPRDRAPEFFEETVPVSDASLGRDEWPDFRFGWASGRFYHQPLYFQDAGLERYGQSRCYPALQPVASSIHFFGNAAAFPIKLMLVHPRSYTSTPSSLRPHY